jgi:hypothetical protein
MDRTDVSAEQRYRCGLCDLCGKRPDISRDEAVPGSNRYRVLLGERSQSFNGIDMRTGLENNRLVLISA